MTQYDAVVVGGGHNGLVAAAYLARSGLRTVVCEARDVVGGAAVTEQPFGPDYTGHVAVLRGEPAAAVAGRRPVAGPARLPRLPARPVLRAALRRPLPRAAGRPCRATRAGGQVLRQGRRRHRGLGRRGSDELASMLAPLLAVVPPKVGSLRPTDLLGQLGLLRHARGMSAQARRRGDPAVLDVDRRPARRLLRVRRDEGAPVGERRDRQLGRAAVGRDRLRDGPPPHRRRRRCHRRLGLPARRDGRGHPGDGCGGADLRCGDPHRRTGGEDHHARRRRDRCRCWRTASSSPRRQS